MTTPTDGFTVAEIKSRVRKRLPKSTFQTNPLRLLWVPFWFLVALAGYYVILMTPAHWSLNLLMALMIGHCWSVLNMIGHEILHGGMGGSKNVQRWLASLCGTPVLVPAYVWELGHMYRHHAATNHPFRDSDAIGLMSRFVGRTNAQKLIDQFPGSHRWSSLLFYTYALTYQQADRGLRMKGHKGRVVKIEFTLMILFWAAVSIASGWNVIYTVIIPFMVGNAISLSYITTQHWLRPLSKENNAVATTLGLSQPKWLASLHLNNAYHLEHHLFPSIPFNKLPVVRKVLMEEFPDKMLIMPHWQALKWTFQTPRVYADENHLVDLRDPSRWFDLRAFERAILDPDVDLRKRKVSDFMVPQG